ncbi:MAG TPA: hypothetical protein VF221_19295, partial [Chloroflexota bacterium]
IRVVPWIPAEWPHLRTRRRVGSARFEIRYNQPHPAQHCLTLHLLDELPAGYTLQLGIRVPARSRVLSASCNGSPMADGAWSYEASSAPDTPGTALLTRPLDGDVELEVQVGA